MPPEAVQLRVTDDTQKPQTSIDQPARLLPHRLPINWLNVLGCMLVKYGR
jgi:hypothetical protein